MKLFFAVAALTLTCGCISIQDSGGGSRALQSKSPTGLGTAIFTKEIGPQDNAVNFDVIDPKVGDKPIDIGLVGDDKWQGKMPRQAVWSKDGSVIAVQSADSKTWSHAYDFRASRNYADVFPDDKRAIAIEKLLKTRGGIGPKVLDNWAKFDQVARPSAENGR